MAKVGIVYSKRYMDHDTGGHVENVRRVSAIHDALKDQPWSQKLDWIEPREATVDQISMIHKQEYIDYVKKSCGKISGIAYLNPDTAISPESYDVALLAAGGVLEGIDRLVDGSLDGFFAMVRPPGHHAEHAESLGFCLFNNIAIGARYAIEKHGMSRVFILDWDVHHGNGTQHTFEADPSVFFCSLHQYPHYPGTGSREQMGHDEGRGYTLNFPMKGGSGDADYLYLAKKYIAAAVKKFKPELLLISAGFDAHERDPLAGIDISSECYGDITSMMMEAAGPDCKTGMVLEGGYNLGAISEAAACAVGVLAEEEPARKIASVGKASTTALELGQYIEDNHPFFAG